MQAPDNSVQALPPEAASKAGGEIRLSFRFFYVVLKWGQERRSLDRVNQDREKFPVLTSTHMPVLAAIYATFFLLLYVLLTLGIEALVYLVS
jgi:hypothetical protein